MFRSSWTLSLLCVTSLSLAVSAADPRVQSLVPGLRIQRLPVDLTNINSLEYGPDGRLYAAGYDGRIHVLTDTDNDGVEDHAQLFWSKPGDLMTPVGILPTQEGVYVAARGKIALLTDTNGDGKADKSRTVVSGWEKETVNSDTRNDAAGVMIDNAGNLYFSLGCMSYNKAWQLDKKGKSRYDATSERGTILKVSRDRKSREIVATGLRFVIGLDINQHGDLFATDQEGDTWFPGGNPRDELLHIVPDRHYGFPFRHPKHLPDSIDEPYVVGFSPQHQSACGFRFNETRDQPGQTIRSQFGPRSWEGNAIVSGFSRGKLWRVPLAKTRAGYVGRQVQFAAFESLLTDVAISPRGDLLVTGHSGSPDWGAGPSKPGHLYRISLNKSAPQPVAAWSASPIEMKIAFDKPIDTQKIGQDVSISQNVSIEAGEFVWEGHRYEWIFPGYEVVKAAKASVRRPLKVASVSVSDDARTVTLTTAPQPWNARYAITLPGVAATTTNQPGETIELSCDLSGVQATWTGKDEGQSWTGWLPSIDTHVIRAMTVGSASHERFLSNIGQPGVLAMRTQLLLPGKEVTFRWEGSLPFQVKCKDQILRSQLENGKQVAQMKVTSTMDGPAEPARGDREQVLPTERVPLEIRVNTGPTNGEFVFDASYHADFDPHERPLRLDHLFVPWASRTLPQPTTEEAARLIQKVAGDPKRGREIFFGSKANCAACHSFAGQGGKLAADLTVCLHRDPEAVMRDIVNPNDSINPDYVSYSVLTDDGKVLTGLFESANKKEVVLIDSAAKAHAIARSGIEDIRASSVSLMPTGFDKLGKDDLQDLVAYLCSEDGEARRSGVPTGVILLEHFSNVKGGISGLVKDKRFPGKPSEQSLLKRFETQVNGPSNFGTRIRGYLHPPKTGDYVFWVAADDEADLWLSTTDAPKDKVRIVSMKRWTPSRDWDRYPEQKSKPIRLEAGRRYYVETLQHERTVDDCLAVGWQLPDNTLERPIPGSRLSSVEQ